MIYLKSLAAGVAAAFATVVAAAAAFTIGSYAWLQFETRASGSGGIGAVSAGIAESAVVVCLVLALPGFAAGFWWQYRRASRDRANHGPADSSR